MKVFNIAQIIGVTFLILFFYATSICLVFYNKWMSKRYRFPLSVTMVHFVVVFLLATLFRCLLEFYYKKKRVVLEWGVYLKQVFPTAIAGSLDIGLSNWSIMLSTVSVYTMAKSTTIIFLMIFSLLFGLEKPNRHLFAVAFLISTGLFLFTFESQQFNMAGFAMALLASFFSGIRWTLTQVVMQKESLGLQNPLDAIFHIQPVMALTMSVFSFPLEGFKVASSPFLFRAEDLGIAMTSSIIILGGACLAFLLTVAEFLLLSNTSGIALNIAGIFKEICTLTIAAEFGGDRWTELNVIGLVVCMSGITLHVVRKALKEPEAKKRSAHKNGQTSMSMRSLLRGRKDMSDSEDEIIWDTSLK